MSSTNSIAIYLFRVNFELKETNMRKLRIQLMLVLIDYSVHLEPG
jgi:hypothetical protein